MKPQSLGKKRLRGTNGSPKTLGFNPSLKQGNKMKALETSVAWKILCFFLEPKEKPGESSVHVQGLARKLGISPGSASIICRQLLKEGILLKEMRGNGAYYSLNIGQPLAQSLQKAFITERAIESGLPKDERIQAAIIYGSPNKLPAKLLVLTNLRPPYCQRLLEPFLKRFGLPTALKVMTAETFEELARARDLLFLEVLENHVDLKGSIESRPGEAK